jgi:integrase
MISAETPYQHEQPLPVEALELVVEALGPLPAIVRYFDEYEETVRSIRSSDAEWRVEADGRVSTARFVGLDDRIAHIIKHFAINRINKNAQTGRKLAQLCVSHRDIILPLLAYACGDAFKAIKYLRTEFFSAASRVSNSDYFLAGKALLYFFCDAKLADWDASHANILRSVSSPIVTSKHRSVRDGSSIISFAEERTIVAYFDDLNATLLQGSATSVPSVELRDACILFWSYAHAIRPIQIANRNVGHVRIRTQNDGKPIVHLTFRYAKQRGNAKVMEQTRKMKRDWAPMMAEWLRRRSLHDPAVAFDRPNSLFGAAPPEITQIIAQSTERITGVRRVPYDLRHSAAQRKADAGCSRFELAEFLMHHDIDTADTYIEMSPTQAEKINQALGLSPLFQAIDKSLKSRSVSFEELNSLPHDQQVGAAPHGHLISGIGGCSVGQSFCTKTPALACYDCGKFMYLRDPEVHRSAREAVQKIVQEFVDAGRTDRASPAFLQLRNVLETIDAIVEELDPDGDGGAAS